MGNLSFIKVLIFQSYMVHFISKHAQLNFSVIESIKVDLIQWGYIG